MSTKCPICLKEFDDNINECPACGFKFSSNTTKFKPIKIDDDTDKNNSFNTNNKHNTVAILRVISGPQGEIVLPLAKEKMTIGRSPNSDIFLNERTVSREHAIISKKGGTYQIMDCDSYNGLWVNNKNVSVSEIHNGDTIQVGVFCLRFENNS